MARSVPILLLAIGVAAGGFIMWRRTPNQPARAESRTTDAKLASLRNFSSVGEGGEGNRNRPELEERLARLETALAREAHERQRLQERLDSAMAQLRCKRSGAGGGSDVGE